MPRLAATKILIRVIFEKKSLSELRYEITKVPTKDRALVQELCYGVTRWFYQLNYIIDQFLHKPLKPKDCDIFVLLLIGLYQIIYTRIPDHAALSETVNAARVLKKEWATKLINAVLRGFLRTQNAILEKLPTNEEAYYAHPLWLIKELKSAWKSWKVILETNNQYPPQCLRVNALKISREDYLTLLTKEGIVAEIIPGTQKGILLIHAVDVNQLPKFEEGYVSIQDGSAQLAASLLAPLEKEVILDACAAPGGKTCHIAELQPNLKELIALDNDPIRLKRVKENLERLKLNATLVCDDVLSWHKEDIYDRILLDVPCSATGVIRRHPDIKLLRQPSDISVLAKLQYKALETLWPSLKLGGRLVYITCSILPDENEKVVAKFLKNTPNCIEEDIEATWGLKVSVGRQILPGMSNGMDGFYFAQLKKIAN